MEDRFGGTRQRQGSLEVNVIRQIEIDLGLRNREIREIFRK